MARAMAIDASPEVLSESALLTDRDWIYNPIYVPRAPLAVPEDIELTPPSQTQAYTEEEEKEEDREVAAITSRRGGRMLPSRLLLRARRRLSFFPSWQQVHQAARAFFDRGEESVREDAFEELLNAADEPQMPGRAGERDGELGGGARKREERERTKADKEKDCCLCCGATICAHRERYRSERAVATARTLEWVRKNPYNVIPGVYRRRETSV